MSNWADPWKELREAHAKCKERAMEIREAEEEKKGNPDTQVPLPLEDDPDSAPDPDLRLNAKLMARVQKISSF